MVGRKFIHRETVSEAAVIKYFQGGVAQLARATVS